jgi:hypothetical protein
LSSFVQFCPVFASVAPQFCHVLPK